MLYNVSQLLMEQTGSIRRFKLDEPVPGDMVGLMSGRVQGTVRLLRTHQGLLVDAIVNVEVGASCARCLADVARQTTLTLEEECYPTIDPATGRRAFPPDESEGVVHIDTRQMLDLSDVLRQYLLTEAPLKTLCRTDCRGLCQDCGADLNLESCRCGESPVDPRWGALVNLLSEEGN